jgi:putative CocE/NonD family hydrolase
VYYGDEALRYQTDFFDFYLKELDNGFENRPSVRLEVRETRDTYFVRYVDSWPVPDAEYRPLYLNAANGQLELTEQDNRSEVTYDPLTESATFSLLFDEDTELSGNMKLKLWVSTTEGEDMDLFTAVDKLDRNGTKIDFYAKMSYIYGPVALGWLRVSQRGLDEERSTPWQPVFSHVEAKPIKPNDVVPVEIEILPSSTMFRAGEMIRVTVQGRDIVQHASLGHGYPVNQGTHAIHTGGPYDSHLLVPMVPGSENEKKN